MIWQILIGFLLGILAFIFQEHIRLYFKILSSIKATKYYLKKIDPEIERTSKHFKSVENTNEYAFQNKSVKLDKYFSEQFTILTHINNENFLDNILQPLVSIEKLGNNLEHCYLHALNPNDRSQIQNKFFKKTYDETYKILEDLPKKIDQAINEIDKTLNKGSFKRYLFLMHLG